MNTIARSYYLSGEDTTPYLLYLVAHTTVFTGCLLVPPGHVMFEMICGFELTELCPSEQQYRDIKDRKLRDILEYIFLMQDGAFIATIDEVL